MPATATTCLLAVTEIERRATAEPVVSIVPWGEQVAQQRWDVLSLHWCVDPEALRALLPEACAPDVRSGGAWLTASIYSVRRSRWTRVPRALGRAYREMEVSACVRWRGSPGRFILRREAEDTRWSWLAAWMGFPPAERVLIEHQRFAHDDTVWDARLPGGRPWFRVWCHAAPGRRSTAPVSLERFLVERPLALHLSRSGLLCAGAIRQQTCGLGEARAVVVADELLRSLGIGRLAALPTLCHHATAVGVRLSRPLPV